MSLVLLCALPIRAEERRTFCGKSLDAWIRVLRDKTSRERASAALALGAFGPAASAAVPDLVEALRDDRGRLFERNAIEALGQIGPDAAPAVPLLIARFRKQGCNLAKAGSFGELDYGNPKDALARIGAAAVPALVEVLDGPDEVLRPCAAEILAKIGPPARAAVPALIRALQQGRRTSMFSGVRAFVLRRHAIMALGRIGPQAGAAVPALNALLDQEGEHSVFGEHAFLYDSWTLVDALRDIGAPPVARLLDVFLRKGHSGAARELSLLGPDAGAAVPALRTALADRRLRVRIDAAVALAHIAPPAPEAVPVLIDALDHHPDEALHVPAALARLGLAAEAALPSLTRLVEEGRPEYEVVKALVQIDPEGRRCVPALIAALKDKDPAVADAAAEALGLLGPRAKAAVPALIAALTRQFDKPFANYDPHVSAAKALGRVGPAARSAIPALIRAVGSRHIVAAGHGFGREQDEVDFAAAEAAARVLGGIGPAASGAVPALIEVLRTREKDDENWIVRREAALALGQLGPDAKAAIPALREAMREAPPHRGGVVFGYPPQVSDAAVVALSCLAPDGKDLAGTWVASLRAPERRAFVLGAMGRTSLEGEWLARYWLERLDRALAGVEYDDDTIFVEGYFEQLAIFGVGAAPAIPRLNELRRHRNPWIRRWAGEALSRIRPAVSE